MIALLALPLAGLALALTGLAGEGAVAAAVVIATLLLAVVLPSALDLHDHRGTATVAALAGVAAATLALAEAEIGGGRPDTLDPLLPVLALVLPAAAVAQLARRGSRTNVIGSIAAATAAGALCVLGSGWVTLTWTPLGDSGVVVAGTAIAASGAVLLAGPYWARAGWAADVLLGLAILAGALGGAISLVLLDPGAVSLSTAAALGLVAGATSVLARSWVVVATNEARIRSGHDAEAEPGTAAPVSVATHDADVLLAGTDQALVAATCAAVLLAAVPVYVVSRILVG